MKEPPQISSRALSLLVCAWCILLEPKVVFSIERYITIEKEIEGRPETYPRCLAFATEQERRSGGYRTRRGWCLGRYRIIDSGYIKERKSKMTKMYDILGEWGNIPITISGPSGLVSTGLSCSNKSSRNQWLKVSKMIAAVSLLLRWCLGTSILR